MLILLLLRLTHHYHRRFRSERRRTDARSKHGNCPARTARRVNAAQRCLKHMLDDPGVRHSVRSHLLQQHTTNSFKERRDRAKRDAGRGRLSSWRCADERGIFWLSSISSAGRVDMTEAR